MNYDFFDTSVGKYYTILRDTEGNEHIADMSEYDESFQPGSTEIIQKHYFLSDTKTKRKSSDVSIYDTHKHILTINDEHIDISRSQKYQEFVRIFLQKFL